LARDELHHGAHHSVEKLMRKVSSKNLQSKCSHESSDDDEIFFENKRPSSASPTPTGPQHRTQRPRDQFPEREGVRGQTLSEEAEKEVSSMDERSDKAHRRSRSQGYTSLSQDTGGFTIQPVPGQGSSIEVSAIAMESSRRGTASPGVSKSRLAGSEGSGHQEHKKSARIRKSRAKPADLGLEDIDLADSPKKPLY
jgi:hypothetical protein